jgi:hypothetical protein
VLSLQRNPRRLPTPPFLLRPGLLPNLFAQQRRLNQPNPTHNNKEN